MRDDLVFEMRVATAEEIATLECFDYTKLTAINMCPVWGIVRYGLHKSMQASHRSMALEAGAVMHECFAAIRMLQLGLHQGANDHMAHHGAVLFGAARWSAIHGAAVKAGGEFSNSLRNGALECLATGNYVDDPMDKYRTYTNLETALMYYADTWDYTRYPIWVSNSDDPTALVGVEIPFAMYVSITSRDGEVILDPFIYTGRIDGLHINPKRNNEPLVQENKTGARLNEAWAASFDMSHQVTGYTITASVYTEQDVRRALVFGLQIPVPRDVGRGLQIIEASRPDFMREQWLVWLMHTVKLYREYIKRPLDAPRHTHSCNRYFTPCSFIPLCATDREEQELILNEQMVTDEWSPLHERKE